METVINAWEIVDWERLQTKIEAEIESLGVRQDDSEERRKRLVEESNSYRERTNKETRKVAIPLIKAFQHEFDGLIARSQSAESALIDICSQITNLPDPKSLLKEAEVWKSEADKKKQAIEEREALKKKLKETTTKLAEYQKSDAELQKLKGQIVKKDVEHENFVSEAIEEAERRVRDEFEARLDEMNLKNEKMRAENEMLEKKLNDIEAKNRDVERKLDMAKLAVDQKEALESEQLLIAIKDLNDANHRIVVLEEKIAELNAELENESKATSKSAGIADIAAFGGLMIEKDEQIRKMNAEIVEKEKKHQFEIKNWKEKVSNLEKEQNRQNVLIEELKAQLEARNDYEAIKRELKLLREIEFGETAEANADSIERLGETVETLDRLLAEKNRRLQNENANLRVMNEGYKGDDLLKAIVAGNHGSMVEAVEKNVGAEMVTKFRKQQQHDGEFEKKIKIEEEEAAAKDDDELNEMTIEDAPLDLLSLLRKIKSESSEKTSTSTVKKHPTHTITTTALPIKKSESSPQGSSSMLDESDLKLSSLCSTLNGGGVVGSHGDEKSPVESETIEKMQSRIHENVRALGTRSLNTMEIARQCKRLMVAYNIGQRLFAKHVMNQVVKSQGSLSELLSKPRHWNKLTDKGREAFRRIYGWISDDIAIELLCSLSPRRVWPSDQKVEHPKCETLWEANSAIIPIYEEAKENPLKATSAREDQYRLAGTGQAGNARGSGGSGGIGTTPIRSSRWRHDDISKEKIMSIFQTELAKLKEQESNIEKAIVGKNHSAINNHHHHQRRLSTTSSSGALSPSPEKFRVSTVEKVMKQRINSGLMAVTQQQYDDFPNIDTEHLVKQIKDFLTINSISQRQFGEHVLGLSQGSVSDLLARPKAWTHLTQKGREPFIRMKMFLDDVVTMANGEEDGGESTTTTSAMIEPTPHVESIRVLDEDSDLAKTLASILNGQNGVAVEIKMEPEPLSEIDLIMQTESGSNLEGLVKYINNNGQEILDTYEIVNRVKKILEENSISCRVFGDYFLRCSPTMCADVFLRTKPFENAKPIEKEVYAKMKSFIGDREAILMLIQKEAMRDAPKDKYDAMFQNLNGNGVSTTAAAAATTTASSSSSGRSLKRKVSSDGQDDDYEPKKPIQRTIITDFQKDALRFVFINEQHPSQEMCEMLAQKMEMSVRTVQNWFHNHRTRSKAREKEGKVYSDALPSFKHAVKSATWRKDLEEMLARGSIVTMSSSTSTTSSTCSNGSNSPEKWGSDAVEPNDLVSTIISKIKAQTNAKEATPIGNTSPSSVTTIGNQINNNKPARKSLADLLSTSSTSSPSTSSMPIKKKTSGSGGGQLDKLVAKMRQIAEGKEAAANGH